MISIACMAAIGGGTSRDRAGQGAGPGDIIRDTARDLSRLWRDFLQNRLEALAPFRIR
jgi:hypothetical protein